MSKTKAELELQLRAAKQTLTHERAEHKRELDNAEARADMLRRNCDRLEREKELLADQVHRFQSIMDLILAMWEGIAVESDEH